MRIDRNTRPGIMAEADILRAGSKSISSYQLALCLSTTACSSGTWVEVEMISDSEGHNNPALAHMERGPLKGLGDLNAHGEGLLQLFYVGYDYNLLKVVLDGVYGFHQLL